MSEAPRLRGAPAASIALAALCCSPPAASAQAFEAPERPELTALWLATQLVPSPEIAVGGVGARPGLQWQLTPLLYSFGVDPRAPRLRAFVVEPALRQSGSVELFVAPELLFLRPVEPIVRPGVRVYLPLVEHGEALSVSLGLSYQRLRERNAIAAEAGLHLLWGILGVLVSHTPGQDGPAATVLSLHLRYF